MIAAQQRAIGAAWRPKLGRAPAAARPLRLAARAAAGSPAAVTHTAGNGAPLNGGAVPSLAPAAPAPAPAPAAAAAFPDPIPGVVPPAAVYNKVVEAGTAKANLPALKILVLGMLAGIYIGFGALLSQVVGGNCPGLVASNPGLQKIIVGAFGLPMGLMMVIICGAELFTGNTAFVTAAAIEGKATLKQLAKSWTLSYAGNFIGAALFVGAMSASGLLATAAAPAATAVAKTSLTFGAAFTRGILCNVLVCLAIWQATAASSLPGKFIGSWLPVSTFAAIGFEHSVANMFFIPMGMALGAPVTVQAFLQANILPVTLGNIAGGVLVALAYGFAYGSLGKKKAA
ncbi:MAG: Formate/nitrite transporter-domain-containing protein [Monoraphidium minutum]|nr:MAG: Formate/nitrite transporter-domain-containing protein [Monoraphidium minutum]